MKKQSKAKGIVAMYLNGYNPTDISRGLKCTRTYAYKIIAAYKKDNQIVISNRKPDNTYTIVLEPGVQPALITGSPHPDMVNHPPHYTAGGIETIDFIEAKRLDYNLGNVVKYITRADLKGSKIEDLKKARWYLDRAIAKLDNVQGVHQ